MLSSPQKEVANLTAWYLATQRPLPWRKMRDPYAIWVSEVMLQQTQVITAIPYFEKFINRFPTPAALASADTSEVLVLWSGLGYYSRARNLHRGAQYLMEKHGGVFPNERSAALKIPGVGPYTAGAVLSIAYNLPEAIVDGNVQRVFSRFFALRETIESKKAHAFFWEKAALWVQASINPRDFNQGLMELGATVCTKAQPNCAVCPLQAGCEANRLGEQAHYPVRRARRKAEHLFWAAFVHQRKGRIFLKQNGEGEWWEGLWDFPRVEGNSAEGLRAEIKTLKAEPLEPQEHTVTHHRIHVFPYVVKSKEKEKGDWVTLSEARKLPLSALAKKILSSLENHLSPEGQMKFFLAAILFGASLNSAFASLKREQVPRHSAGEFRTQGLFQAGTPGPKNMDSVSLGDFGSAERWAIGFSDPGKPRSFSTIPELQVQYFEEEKVLSDSGELVVATEPKFVLKFRSIRRNALDRTQLAALVRRSKHVKAITLYPAIEGGDTALEFLLKKNVPFRPSLEAGRLLLDLKEPSRF